ncbi:MAG TPA: crosslink repair DNA glycosylase YcaQ family protein [Natronosporangium sp.]
MTVHQLSRADARRIAVRAQLLAKPRPTDLLAVVRQLTLLQIDPTAAIAPNVHLVAWSRLGSAYDPADLDAALAARQLVELHAMIRPSEDVALYRAEMAAWGEGDPGPQSGWRQRNREWVRANDACRRDILARLKANGPLRSRDLPDTCVVPWRSTGWTDNRNVTQLLEFMVARGEVAVAGRSGGDRLWDLAERVYPDVPAVPIEEARRIRNQRRLRSLGIARAKTQAAPLEPWDVGDAGEPAVVEGVKGTWRVDPAQLGQPFAGRAALLSPFDRLIHDRKRMVELFEFDYQLEMYKPVAKRRWGYFALPILYGDRLVGKLDATADRRAGVLRVNAIHQDVPFSKAMTTAIDREIEDLARWLRLELIPTHTGRRPPGRPGGNR